MSVLKRIWEAWLTLRDGAPCPKHPGHRQRELDMELETGCAMGGADMCSECWAEWKEKYNIS
jgi:hypothetical protein